jgi:DNA-binding HxlR family transcriptional regulator
VRYSLTEAGIQVLPIMVALGTWGLAHRDGDAPRASEQLRAAYDAAMRDDTGKPRASAQP